MKTMWSPVVYYMDYGLFGLEDKLNQMDIEYLRKLVSYHHMDGTNKFRKYNKDELVDLILKMSYARAHKGDAFRNL